MNTSKRIGSKKSILFTSLLLCGLFLLLINVQDKDSNHNPSSALEPQIGEVIKRDRQTYTKLVKVDKNGSKQYSITSDMSPLHYLDKAGEWQEYNFHLKKTIKDGYSYELTSSDYQVYFKKTLTSFPAVRIERDGRFIDMQPAELQYVNNDGDSQLISK